MHSAKPHRSTQQLSNQLRPHERTPSIITNPPSPKPFGFRCSEVKLSPNVHRDRESPSSTLVRVFQGWFLHIEFKHSMHTKVGETHLVLFVHEPLGSYVQLPWTTSHDHISKPHEQAYHHHSSRFGVYPRFNHDQHQHMLVQTKHHAISINNTSV